MIVLSNLSKTYAQQTENNAALKGVSFEVRSGEIFGLIGKSGAGKTTLLRILAQLEIPTSGYVDVNGIRIAGEGKHGGDEVKRQLGIVFQNFDLLMQKTVEQNIAFPLQLRGIEKHERMRRVEELLKLVGLSDKGKAYPATLSGGQKQRVAIARALASDPSSLLLDEPTSALDSVTTRSILSLLKEINEQRKVTIIIITHEIGVVKSICQRVAVLDEGNIVEIGSVGEVFTRPQSPMTKLLLGTEEVTDFGNPS